MDTSTDQYYALSFEEKWARLPASFAGVLTFMLLALLALPLSNCTGSSDASPTNMENKSFTVEKSPEQWQSQLGEQRYRVMRLHGTERAFSGEYHDHKGTGIYVCAACGQELFSSSTKYDSGTGWPSYYEPINDEAVGESRDESYGMVRTEVHCARCGGHLGHVFSDGPQPTGLRYCINSISLNFKPSN